MATDHRGTTGPGDIPLLSASALTKRFTGVLANDRLDLEIMSGEVHAVLGENGAGKSTLVNMLGGMIDPDSGTIRWKGAPVSLPSPRAALELGVGVVHQHFMLVPRLTILENVMLGTKRRATGGRAAAERRLRDLAAEFETTVDPRRTVESSTSPRPRWCRRRPSACSDMDEGLPQGAAPSCSSPTGLRRWRPSATG
jgi:ABC-type uncharacterized transport system ATPase subunit